VRRSDDPRCDTVVVSPSLASIGQKIDSNGKDTTKLKRVEENFFVENTRRLKIVAGKK
jgi:hypothetical protein